MPQSTVIAAAGPVCKQAVEAYAAELEKRGWSVPVREVPPDIELTDAPHEVALCVEWPRPSGGVAAPAPHCDWEDWEAESPGEAADGADAPSRLAEQYVETLEMLGQDPEAAAAFLRRLAGAGRRHRAARGRT